MIHSANLSKFGVLLFLCSLGATLVCADTSAAAPAPVEVTTCGQHVDRDGFLAADLDCSAYPYVAVVLEHQGSFDLGGFTLAAGGEGGVKCWRGCEVSNGVITGGGERAIHSESRVSVHDLTVQNGGGLSAYRKLRILNVTVTGGYSFAVSSKRVKAEHATFENQQVYSLCAVCGDRLKLVDVVVTDNVNTRVGVLASRSIRMESTTVSNHLQVGVAATRLNVKDSVIVGNPVDLNIGARPHLKNTTCDTSTDQESPPSTWGVCALD